MKRRYNKKKVRRHNGRSRRYRKQERLRICIIIGIFVLLLAALAVVLFMWMNQNDKENEQYISEAERMETEDNPDLDELMEDTSDVRQEEDNPIVTKNHNGLWLTAADGLSEIIRNQVEMLAEYQEESKITISIMGDSISTFKGYIPEGYYDFFPDNGAVSDVRETWWEPVIGELDLKLYTNASSSGATCIGDSTSQDNPQYGCSDFRINALAGSNGKAPDIIIVYMGTNDLLQSVPLGDNNGLREVPAGNVQNFSDAYTLIMDKLRNRYPDSQIYCCTITQIGTWGTDTLFVELVNGAGEGLRASDYNECIRQIASNKSASVIDLYNCGITFDNLQDTTADGVHPTPLGMSYIANTVKESLIPIISQ